MNLTLYVSEEDQPTIEKCKEKLEANNDSLSRFLARQASDYLSGETVIIRPIGSMTITIKVEQNVPLQQMQHRPQNH